jgi:hypothetical protein
MAERQLRRESTVDPRKKLRIPQMTLIGADTNERGANDSPIGMTRFARLKPTQYRRIGKVHPRRSATSAVSAIHFPQPGSTFPCVATRTALAPSGSIEVDFVRESDDLLLVSIPVGRRFSARSFRSSSVK